MEIILTIVGNVVSLTDPSEVLKWHDKGVELFDLLHKQNFLEKQTLSKLLPWFRYLQLQHLLDSAPITQACKRSKTSFKQLFE